MERLMNDEHDPWFLAFGIVSLAVLAVCVGFLIIEVAG
jgi:hypothetical protein